MGEINPHTILITNIYRPEWLNQEENPLLHNAIRAACHLGIPCLITGDYNYRNIDWKQLTCGSESDNFLDTMQDCFPTQLVDKPAGKDNLLDLVITSDASMVENLYIREPLGPSNYNYLGCNMFCGNQLKDRINMQLSESRL